MPRSVAVTGGLGNLGLKLLLHLARTSSAPLLIGLDVRTPNRAQLAALQDATAENLTGTTPHIVLTRCDLTDPGDRRWRDAVDRVQAVVHFAARNPYPDATWDEAAVSIDMTLNVALAAADSPTLERFVFATSNHVMGRYKDSPLADTIQPGALRPDSPLGVGTVWPLADPPLDATAYSTSKMVGERIGHALAARAELRQTVPPKSFVSVRIGWCQPGENRPETLSATGDPSKDPGSADAHPDPDGYRRADRWFRQMWLSNRDFVQLFERAISAPTDTWPGPSIVVNGMSNNWGMAWSLEETRHYLGYEPQDDVYA